jgi:hypothetical protein
MSYEHTAVSLIPNSYRAVDIWNSKWFEPYIEHQGHSCIFQHRKFNEGAPIFSLLCVHTPCFGPNFVVKWLTFLLHIWEVLGSNLGPETSYPDWTFSYFFSVFPGKCQDRPLILEHGCYLPNLFQFIIHLLSYLSILYSLSYWESVIK